MIKKDYTVSLIRMISTMMVVMLHISQHFEREFIHLRCVTDWLNLGLVMFFTISAFLYSTRNIGTTKRVRWIVHRYTELIIPASLVSITTLIVFLFFKGITIKEVIIAFASGLGLEAFLPEGWMFVHLWFLTYIIICYFSILFIQRFDFKNISNFKFCSIIILITILFQSVGTTISMLTKIPTLSFGIFLRFYFPYMLLRRYDIKSKECKRIMMFLTVASVFAVAFTCFVRYFVSLEGILSSVAELLFIYTQTLAGTVLFYWLYTAFSKYNLQKTILNISDKYSYCIYLTHCLFIGYSTSVIDRFNNVAVGVFVSLICTVVSSFLLEKVSSYVKKLFDYKRRKHKSFVC